MKARTLIAFACALALAGPADAHMLRSATAPAKLPAKTELAYANATVTHATAMIRMQRWRIKADLRRLHPRADGWMLVSSSIEAVVARSDLHEARIALRNHAWLLSYGLRLRVHAEQRLNPWAVPASFSPAAMCVHGGEGAWNSIGPKGSSHPVFGGGMQFMLGTWNHAADTSRGKVRRASSIYDIASRTPAEQIYATFVIVVLDGEGWGQWPNTARACGLL